MSAHSIPQTHVDALVPETPPGGEPEFERWRRQYERDRRAFEHAHGRPPITHYELATWLTKVS